VTHPLDRYGVTRADRTYMVLTLAFLVGLLAVVLVVLLFGDVLAQHNVTDPPYPDHNETVQQ
jgi:hypothetical protein